MSALSSAVALPLVTTSSIANGTSNVYSRPDLAARFDDFYSRWMQKREKDSRERVECEASGLGDDFEWSDPDLDEWNALSEESRELVDAIMAQPAASLADIALQARACAMENSACWTDAPDYHLDSGTRAACLLVEQICRLADVSVFPGLNLSRMA